MKKILILSSGDVGTHFIRRVINTYTSENLYYVVEMKATTYEGVNPARFKFFEFDPTSLYKLSNILKMDFLQVFVVMENKQDVVITIENIKAIKKNLRIIVMDEWGLSNESSNVVLVNAKDILASKLIDFLPNVPVIAQNVGLGEGEVMEVSVPFGSSFVYKHLSVIEQKDWKIAAIYRNQKLLLPTPRRMIQPNDILLLVGEPRVLKSVYRVIKREFGQFPEPFGTVIYLLIDMVLENATTIKRLLEQAVYIQNRLDKELFIRIVNPNDIKMLTYIKSFANHNTTICVEYDNLELLEIMQRDKKLFHIGMIIVANTTFYDDRARNALYELHLPVLKLARKRLDDIKDVALIISENKETEKISNTIFDFSEQFDLNIELYNYLKEDQEIKEQVIEHYTNLAALFSKKIKIHAVEENPVRLLQKRENFLHIVPFSKKLTKSVYYSFFTTDSDLMYSFLDMFHQLFIPVDDI